MTAALNVSPDEPRRKKKPLKSRPIMLFNKKRNVHAEGGNAFKTLDRNKVSSSLHGRGCGCSFRAVQLISNRSPSVSVRTAAQMAPQSAPCKEWIIIITHNLLFNTCLLLQFFKKLHTTVIHKSTSSCSVCCIFLTQRDCVARYLEDVSDLDTSAPPFFPIYSHIQCLHIAIPAVSHSFGRQGL